MNTKLLKIGCYVDVTIGVLGIVCFILLAIFEPARKGEPLSKWIPALIVALLCVVTGVLGLRIERKLRNVTSAPERTDAEKPVDN